MHDEQQIIDFIETAFQYRFLSEEFERLFSSVDTLSENVDLTNKRRLLYNIRQHLGMLASALEEIGQRLANALPSMILKLETDERHDAASRRETGHQETPADEDIGSMLGELMSSNHPPPEDDRVSIPPMTVLIDDIYRDSWDAPPAPLSNNPPSPPPKVNDPQSWEVNEAHRRSEAPEDWTDAPSDREDAVPVDIEHATAALIMQPETKSDPPPPPARATTTLSPPFSASEPVVPLRASGLDAVDDDDTEVDLKLPLSLQQTMFGPAVTAEQKIPPTTENEDDPLPEDVV